MLGAIAANPDHVQRLLKTNQCPLCDLRGANLQDANLFGANLVNANLTAANLAGANLGSANLTDADLTGANLSRAYLHLATLENTNLSQADLRRAYLKDATLINTNFRGSRLQGVNLSRTNLAGVELRGADLSGANLSNTFLTGLRASRAGQQPEVVGINLGSSFFEYLCEHPLDQTVAEGTKHAGFDLVMANLSGTNLSNANLSQAMLANADLRGANLAGADLSGACLNRSQLNHAILDGANLYDTKLDRALLEGASLNNLRNANLSGTVLTALEAKFGPAQLEAQQWVGAMNRAQQAYYLERSQFAGKLEDLGLQVRSETELYLYRVFLHRDRTKAVMVAGVPKVRGLKTFIGVVNASQIVRTGDWTALAALCESESAIPTLPRVPTEIPLTGAVPCPAGFRRAN